MATKTLLATGLLLIALAALATLARSPLTLARTNGVPLATQLAEARSATSGCQGSETLPRDTSAIRLGLFSLLGPRIAVEVLAGSRVVSEGSRGAGWEGTYITVPLSRARRDFTPVTVCFRLTSVNSRVAMLGVRTAAPLALRVRGAALPGRMGVEYLRAGHRRWWSLATSVARRLGFGHAPGGAWDVVAAAALSAAVVALSSLLIVRELR